MKRIKYALSLLLVFVAIYSCSSTKELVETNQVEVRTDTVIKSVTRTVYQGVTDTLIIEEPCDSLGNLKPFTTKIKSASGTAKVTGRAGQIKIDLETVPHVSTDSSTYWRSLYEKSKETTSEKVVTKIIWSKWTYIFLIAALVELIIIGILAKIITI